MVFGEVLGAACLSEMFFEEAIASKTFVYLGGFDNN